MGDKRLNGTQKVFAFLPSGVIARTRFAPTWRACCRRIVEDFVRLKKEQSGETIGSSKLVKAMLDPHRIAGNRAIDAKLDTMLVRQDVEAWLKRGVEFSDMKFHFVDYFVQSILKSDLGLVLRMNLEDYRVRGTAEALGNLYMLQKLSGARVEQPRELLGKTFGSVSSDDEVRQSRTVQFLSEFNGVYYARILISDAAVSNVERGLKTARVLTGYFVPNELISFDFDGITSLIGVLAIQDPALFNLMSPKTAFDSLGLTSFQYGDKTISIHFPKSSVIRDLAMVGLRLEEESSRLELTVSHDPIIEEMLQRLQGAVL